MFSITLKRSAATLGVVAGLLAAAGPASAQIGASTDGLTTPRTGPGPQVAHAGLKADSNEVAVEGRSIVTDNNDPDQMHLTSIREPSRTVTMLDYEGQTVVTYSQKEPQRVRVDIAEELGDDAYVMHHGI
jgi:hypothetical protein